MLNNVQVKNFYQEELRKNKISLLKKDSDEKLAFNEILCPMTGKEIKSGQCHKCSHKVEYLRANPIGITLSSIICNWNEEE